MTMKITFWGVLGSYGRWQPAQPSLKSTDNNNHNTSNLHEPLNIGGHTSCILIEKTTPSDSDSDNETSKTPFLILDAGSGLIPLGKQLCANQKQDNDSKQGSDSKTDCHLLITHPHLDHEYPDDKIYVMRKITEELELGTDVGSDYYPIMSKIFLIRIPARE